MGEKIALGFHTCVDYELHWDTEVMEALIRKFDIHDNELRIEPESDSERMLLISCLAHMKSGTGGEIVPAEATICNDFAEHFSYKVTLGGTATRAAIALHCLGYRSVLQTSCYNKHVAQLIPSGIQVVPGVAPNENDIYPHIILQYAGGIRIHANDIDFVTPRENRILISRDMTSLNIPVLPKTFGPMLSDTEVILLGCFSQVLDWDILKDRVKKTKELLTYLPKDAVVVLEDGCYIKKDFRYYVHQQLVPESHVLSMNEDELQEYIGKRINILNPEAMQKALEYVAQNSGAKILVVHSAAWALAYGSNAAMMKQALIGGVTTAGSRFRVGDALNPEAYAETQSMVDKAEGLAFCQQMHQLLGDRICCIPSKNLSCVKNPTIVGLGDSFAGGLLPGLLKRNRNKN